MGFEAYYAHHGLLELASGAQIYFSVLKIAKQGSLRTFAFSEIILSILSS